MVKRRGRFGAISYGIKNLGGFLMEHYDLRIIEDCLVFSYAVECPNDYKKAQCPPKRISRSRSAEKRKTHAQKMKQFWLHVLLVVLAPFAILLDAVGKVVCITAKCLICVFSKRPAPARIVGVASNFLIMTAFFTAH